MPLETMLRIYFMQQWYALSDPGMEDALYDIESMRRFAGLELIETPIPDETTILKFRRLLERHKLTGEMMEGTTGTDLVLKVVELLRKKGVVGKIGEVYGPGPDHRVLADGDSGDDGGVGADARGLPHPGGDVDHAPIGLRIEIVGEHHAMTDEDIFTKQMPALYFERLSLNFLM